jgi:prepilin-type N-terminal cleavage/methylation domain-containing protein
MLQVNRIIYPRNARVRGLSLIEVLVAITILTIGMLAILILFPAGMFALQTAANSTNADRLGQAELEKTSASQLQLIGAVYANDGVTSNVNPVSFIQSASAQITDTGPQSNATAPDLTNGTDVDAFRYIAGETVRIPAPNAQGLSLYTVLADPMESGSLIINGTPWQGISGNIADADPLQVLQPNQPQYLIDYTNGEIALSPQFAHSVGGTYDEPIVFTMTDNTGVTRTQLLKVPMADVGTWMKISSIPVMPPGAGQGTEGNLPWVAGSDILVRNFRQVGPTTGYAQYVAPGLFTADHDPYEWQPLLPDYTATTAAKASANLGVIVFNPALNGMHGVDGLPVEAVLNYRTFDWHIISEDRTVSSALSTSRLSLVNLLSATAGDILSDNATKFSGLFTYSGATTFTTSEIPALPAAPDFIVLDMDTGYILIPGTDYTVNYPAGSIAFINSSNPEYVNDHLRIFYHPADDWAVSLARAPLIYSADTNATHITNFTPAISNYILPSSGTETTIYFPLVDLGKQVEIRFQYIPSGSTATTTVDGLYTIKTAGAGGAGVDLTDVNQQTSPIPSGAAVTPISIKGTSLSAVVIWRENGIWHNRTISTVLPPHNQTSPTNLQ